MIKEADIKFRIIGFKNEDRQLKSHLRQILSDKVELIDSLDKHDLINQLCSSDILVIPRSKNFALQLAFPSKFAEYIATGKPVIVTDVDETANFVRKYNCGFVCAPSAQSIARTIVAAKKLPLDKLLEMGSNGRRLAETTFDLRVIGTQYFNFLCQNLPDS
jgi:glycosyltransferase involved in cell wall biosynthesis